MMAYRVHNDELEVLFIERASRNWAGFFDH